MSEIDNRRGAIEQLVDRHAELCQIFEGATSPEGGKEPHLICPSFGRSEDECLADLVDQALEVYQYAGSPRDRRVFALKIALTDAIMELAFMRARY